jgi:hypothetical protein
MKPYWIGFAPLIVAFASVAQAQDRGPDEPQVPSIERPFLYMPEAALPVPGHAAMDLSIAFAASTGATRPLAAIPVSDQPVGALTGEWGVVRRLSLVGQAAFASLPGDGNTIASAVSGGIHALLVDPSSHAFRIATLVVVQRELSGAIAVATDFHGQYDFGRWRLAGCEHIEHAFAQGRDAVDLYSVIGVSARVRESWRVGAEYVAQELEALFDREEAEGGLRHFMGANASASLGRRWIVTFGPAFGVDSASPRVMARASVATLF